MTRPSPVTFAARAAGVFDIRLGVHCIGTLMPRGDGRAFIWSCALPPMSDMRWHMRPSLASAQRDCVAHIEQWLEGVGPWCGRALAQWQTAEARERKHEVAK